MTHDDAGPTTVDRALRLPGAHNLRDLGGLRTRDGQAVRRGRVWRSDYPGFADLDGGSGLGELGLRTVVDLRRRTEVDVELPDWARRGVAYVREPLVAVARDSWHASYHSYLSHRPERVVAAVERVMDPTAHPVLFHCAAGKDRTGVVAALVLEVLGVPREDVVADYTRTAESLEAVLARLLRIPLYAEMLGARPDRDQVPRAENLLGLLAWLDERGGAERWLLAHGLESGTPERFRAAMLER